MAKNSRRFGKIAPFLFAVLAPALALAGQTSRSAPPTGQMGGGMQFSSLPQLNLPAIGTGLKIPGVDASVTLPPINLGSPVNAQISAVGQAGTAVPFAPSQGAASADAHLQASSPKGSAGSEAFNSVVGQTAEPLKIIAEAQTTGENSYDAGRKLELALTGSKDSGSDGFNVTGGFGGRRAYSYMRLRAMGLRAPMPNPADYYEDAYEQAALAFAKQGFAREDVRFGGVTGNIPGGPRAHFNFTFYASKTPGAKQARAVYVDYAPEWAVLADRMGSRVTSTNMEVPVHGALFDDVNAPAFFARQSVTQPEAAVDQARALLSKLGAGGISFALRFEAGEEGEPRLRYRLYDGAGNVAAVDSNTGNVVEAKAAPEKAPLPREERLLSRPIVAFTALGASILQAVVSHATGFPLASVLFVLGVGVALTLWRGWDRGVIPGRWLSVALGVALGGALGWVFTLAATGVLGGGMIGMLSYPKPLPNPSEYYEDAYEYAVMQAEKHGYARADVRFGGVTGTLPVPADRHLMFTFNATKSSADKQGAIIYVDYAPKWGFTRGRMGSVGAILKNGPVENPVFDGVNALKDFSAAVTIAPEQALDLARANTPSLERAASFKLAFEADAAGAVAPWYSFYDGLGNHVKVGGNGAAVRAIAVVEPKKGGLDGRTIALWVLGLLGLALIIAKAAVIFPALALLGVFGLGMVRDLPAFEKQMQARFGRMRGVTSVTVETVGKKNVIVIEAADRASLEKLRASSRVPGTTQGVRVVTRLNAQAQAEERATFENQARQQFGALKGLASITLTPESGEPRGLTLEFTSPAALAAAKTLLTPKLGRLFVTSQLTPVAAEAEKQRLELERQAKAAAEKARREFAARLRAAFPDAPGFVRAYLTDNNTIVVAYASAEALAAAKLPASFENYLVAGAVASAPYVTDAQIEASVKSLAYSKGRPWSSTEYNMMYAGSVESLRRQGATEWQLQRFSDLEALEPVHAGGFNPWSGD